jgi:WYL domain
VHRPAGFDLRAAWEQSVGEVEQRRTGVRVQALADPAILPVLLAWLGRERVAVGETAPDGRVEVTVAGPSLQMIVANVAGLGRRLEVLTPEARPLLAALAEELAELYG